MQPIPTIRRDLHANPELGFEEVRTSDLIARQLESLGIPLHRDAGHGEGPCMLHTPSYDFNDALIPLGATMWVRLAEAWLASRRLISKGSS